jgi:hypothetical protein
MSYIEKNKDNYIRRKKNNFICDHCLKERDIEQKTPYTSFNEEAVFCWPCVNVYHETGEW